ncbi:hypothetical protein EVAR_68902_1 [Eumeta japonica]|uniref:Uncharacterized protein n=1 Tax=Eumeta variegata TaxID=151549 RepID=A0A4C1ZV29_EUMVA|nr:hypothetical protein EVAR_68902_1 [Eumeta japonica]
MMAVKLAYMPFDCEPLTETNRAGANSSPKLKFLLDGNNSARFGEFRLRWKFTHTIPPKRTENKMACRPHAPVVPASVGLLRSFHNEHVTIPPLPSSGVGRTTNEVAEKEGIQRLKRRIINNAPPYRQHFLLPLSRHDLSKNLTHSNIKKKCECLLPEYLREGTKVYRDGSPEGFGNRNTVVHFAARPARRGPSGARSLRGIYSESSYGSILTIAFKCKRLSTLHKDT